MFGEVSPVLKVKETDEQIPEQVSGRTRVRGRLLSHLSPRALAIDPCSSTLHSPPLYSRSRTCDPHPHHAVPLAQALVKKDLLERLPQLADVSQVLNFKVTEKGASGSPNPNPRPDDVTPSLTTQRLPCRVQKNFSGSSTRSSAARRSKTRRTGKTRSRPS